LDRVAGQDGVLECGEIALRIESSGTLPYGPASVRYGLGNWGDVGSPVPTRGHGGFMPGYASYYRYSVTRGFGLAVQIEPLNGEQSTCPIAPETRVWLLSPRKAIEGLILGHELPAPAFGVSVALQYSADHFARDHFG
jgi:hypothetical protein